MAADADELRVPFYWEQDGIQVTKTYILRRDSYVIDVEYRVQNNSQAAIKLAAYGQLQRNDPGREGRRLLYTYTGAVLSTTGKPLREALV